MDATLSTQTVAYIDDFASANETRTVVSLLLVALVLWVLVLPAEFLLGG
jgi:hypothetical protein